MEKKKPHREAFNVKVRENGNTFWHRIGTSFLNRDNSETVLLDSLPPDGRIVLRDYRERPQKEAA